MYNINSADSIIDYAKLLKDQTLRTACDVDFNEYKINDKGGYGKTTEKYYFKYEPNSDAEPDFKEAGLELKCSPLKTLKNGDFRSKERLVLNIINYLEVHKEDFENSSFWKKNAHLLLVFYLHDSDLDLLDYLIKLVDGWQYPDEDLKIIKQDWEFINQKIKNGKAHELSEGDTFYLGACTKGSTALKSFRNQPFNEEQAKQRAYSLKQGYVNHIIANIAQEETAVYGKIIERPEILDKVQSIEEIVILKFHPFYGKSAEQVEQELGLELNKKAKNYFANLTNTILGLELGQKIEGESLILRKVKFWNMPHSDILEAKNVWEEMVKTVSNGEIVKEVTEKGVRKTFFPKKTDNRISHVRPHARNSEDTYELPLADKLTGLTEYTKHCFWLNAGYVKDKIYLS
mgnify:CR=1 FL=1|tara:strand:+ start:835 stop:2040 length:1206 start_codon:yes stop_codon:yes gene_type:complete